MARFTFEIKAFYVLVMTLRVICEFYIESSMEKKVCKKSRDPFIPGS